MSVRRENFFDAAAQPAHFSNNIVSRYMSTPHHTRGIVLRRINYSETSVILTIFTEALGMRKYLVNGVRTARATTKSALYQPMSMLELVAFQRDDRDLNRLGEVRAAYVYRDLPFNVLKGAVGLFLAEVAQKTIREADPNAELFEFLYETFVLLDQYGHGVANVPVWFLTRLSAHLGFRPSGKYGADTPFFDLSEGLFVAEMPSHPWFLPPEEAEALSLLNLGGVADGLALPLAGGLRRNLLLHLLTYYKLHLEHMAEIHAHIVLQEVL